LQDAGVNRLPANESQCRPLYRLIDRPKDLVKAWKGRSSTTVDSERASTGIDDDFFPTPLPVIKHLFDRERFTGSIWDCSCGDARIVRVARQYYPKAEVVGTDLNTGADFLTIEGMTADNIITNPPFGLKDDFVARAMDLSRRAVAMLLPLDVLSGKERFETIHSRADFQLTTVWVYVHRIKFITTARDTSPGFPLCWFVWRKRTKQQAPVIKWID